MAKILFEFELEGRMYGGDERRKKKSREKRGESLSGGRGKVRKKRGECTNY